LAEGYDFYTGIDSQISPLSQNRWLHLTSLESDEEISFFSRLPSALHRGEASCLAIAFLRGWAFLTDDARARSVVREFKLLVSGTLGILIKSVEKGILSLAEADNILNRMIKVGGRIPRFLLGEG
jgi:predicted nucleic acid-binding protein